MAREIAETNEPICTCGHPASAHWSEVEVTRFNGLFNPALAGRVEEHVWMRCDGDEIDPCSTWEHSWH